ncbi:peptidase [Clostridium sp. DMHC 10]|nr:S8 family serine peptidase [Clostridium sp. DMHC 10]KOF57536.1 peptidase [Clostridium sp. DMHC 10]
MFFLKSKIDSNLYNLTVKNEHRSFRILIHCKNFINRIASRLKSHKCTVYYTIDTLNCICASASSFMINRLTEYPEIDYITLDNFASICAHNVHSANNVSTALANNSKLTGRGIRIGIIDTGVYPHKDLKYPTPKIHKFLDLINGLNYPYDDNGHGTFMSGLIAASGSSSKGKYMGIAPETSIYMIKAFEATGKAYVSSILAALNILIKESAENNIRIICLPFETFFQDSFIDSMFSRLFTLANKNNLAVVVPSGSNKNDKNSMIGISTLSNCVTVSGVTSSIPKKIYTYSSSGPCGKPEKPDLCAACTDLTSLNCDTSFVSERNGIKLYPRELKEAYTTYTGTSCAAAFTTGILALLFEKNPDLKYKDAVSMIKTSCKLLNVPKWQQGYGCIDFKDLFFDN